MENQSQAANQDAAASLQAKVQKLEQADDAWLSDQPAAPTKGQVVFGGAASTPVSFSPSSGSLPTLSPSAKAPVPISFSPSSGSLSTLSFSPKATPPVLASPSSPAPAKTPTPSPATESWSDEWSTNPTEDAPPPPPQEEEVFPTGVMQGFSFDAVSLAPPSPRSPIEEEEPAQTGVMQGFSLHPVPSPPQAASPLMQPKAPEQSPIEADDPLFGDLAPALREAERDALVTASSDNLWAALDPHTPPPPATLLVGEILPPENTGLLRSTQTSDPIEGHLLPPDSFSAIPLEGKPLGAAALLPYNQPPHEDPRMATQELTEEAKPRLSWSLQAPAPLRSGESLFARLAAQKAEQSDDESTKKS